MSKYMAIWSRIMYEYPYFCEVQTSLYLLRTYDDSQVSWYFKWSPSMSVILALDTDSNASAKKFFSQVIMGLASWPFSVTLSLWEVNFSRCFFKDSDSRFRFLSKEYLHKVSSFLENSNGNTVKNVKNRKKTGWVQLTLVFGDFLHFWQCSSGNI